MQDVAERFSVKGLVTVVTGASSGIGRHMASVLADAGASLVLVARRAPELEALADQMSNRAQNANVATVTCDLNAVEDFQSLAKQLTAPFGAPTRLINAAGVNFRQPVDDITPHSWNQTINLNLSVPFFLSRALVAGMQGNGSIINIASLRKHGPAVVSEPMRSHRGSFPLN